MWSFRDVNDKSENPKILKIGSRHVFQENNFKYAPIVDKENKLGTKIDWHDWEAVGADLRRQGDGENGASVKLAPDEEGKSSSSYINHGFSAYVSDKIAVDRSVPDIRHAL